MRIHLLARNGVTSCGITIACLTLDRSEITSVLDDVTCQYCLMHYKEEDARWPICGKKPAVFRSTELKDMVTCLDCRSALMLNKKLSECRYCGAMGKAWKGECPECPKGAMKQQYNTKDPQKWLATLERKETGTACPNNVEHTLSTSILFDTIEICPSMHRLDTPVHDRKWEFYRCFKPTEYIMVHKYCDQCGYVESTRHWPNGDEVRL